MYKNSENYFLAIIFSTFDKWIYSHLFKNKNKLKGSRFQIFKDF